MVLDKGYIHIYTGPGKGKTTAALGLGLRAAGAGFRVYMIQFMKGRRYSELDAVEYLPNFAIVQFGRDEFVRKENPEQVDVDLAQQGLAHAQKIIEDGNYDMVILDEINVAIEYGLISLNDALHLVEKKPEALELVFTGRDAHPELARTADIITEMLEIKHCYQNGVVARKGIDY